MASRGAAGAVASPAAYAMILALQEREARGGAGRQDRQKAARHLAGIVDLLREVQCLMLDGRNLEAPLAALRESLNVVADEVEPALAATLQAVVLRVRVELARHGRLDP